MILIDANLLLYAHDTSSSRHTGAHAWLDGVLNSDETVGIPLQAALAFIRIATHPGVFRRPIDATAALTIVTGWFVRPNVVLASPSERHWAILADLTEGGQARGAHVMDAHIAALAKEHGATLFTTDRGFARFPGLRFKNTIAP